VVGYQFFIGPFCLLLEREDGGRMDF